MGAAVSRTPVNASTFPRRVILFARWTVSKYLRTAETLSRRARSLLVVRSFGLFCGSTLRRRARASFHLCFLTRANQFLRRFFFFFYSGIQQLRSKVPSSTHGNCRSRISLVTPAINFLVCFNVGIGQDCC